MNPKILLIGSLLFALSPVSAHACPSKVRNAIEYARRDNNRCEGLTDSRPSTNLFTLVSFSTGNLNSYPNLLTIRIPSRNSSSPDVVVQSVDKNYRLDELALRPTAKGFVFPLNTRLLRDVGVAPQSLWATAQVQPDSNSLYLPVVFGNPSGRYEFVVVGPESLALPIFEIRFKGKRVFSSPKNYQAYSHTLTWTYGQAARGTYELYVKDDRGRTRRFRFEHNPQWL